jgi:hypothetical protein
MMELMQKYTKDDGAVGIDNLDRWQTCPAAIDFLSATISASSCEELKKVCDPIYLIWNCAYWFLAALINRNAMVPGRFNRPRMVCSDIRPYILLIHAEIGRQRLGHAAIAYVPEKGSK